MSHVSQGWPFSGRASASPFYVLYVAFTQWYVYSPGSGFVGSAYVSLRPACWSYASAALFAYALSFGVASNICGSRIYYGEEEEQEGQGSYVAP